MLVSSYPKQQPPLDSIQVVSQPPPGIFQRIIITSHLRRTLLFDNPSVIHSTGAGGCMKFLTIQDGGGYSKTLSLCKEKNCTRISEINGRCKECDYNDFIIWKSNYYAAVSPRMKSPRRLQPTRKVAYEAKCRRNPSRRSRNKI